MKKTFYRFFLLNKRLYKKPVFIIILALIPLLMLSFELVAQDSGGLVRIALTCEDRNDTFSQRITERLISRDGLILFTEAESSVAAIDMVKSGKADAAWIFPSDTLQKAKLFSEKHGKSNYIVEIYQREQSIPLRLSTEVLCNEFFRYCSRSMYINYIHENVSELASLSDDELLGYYDEFDENTELFDFTSSESSVSESSKNILLSPLRGLLSVIVLLCGFAATLFFIQDKQSGTFSLIPEEKLPVTGYICQLIAILNVGLVMFISLFITDLSVSFFRELLLLLLFCISCSSFCSIIHLFIRNINIFSALLPLFIIISITVCPVFFDFGSMYFLQLLLPPTHYINAAYDNLSLLYMVLYTVVSTSLFLSLTKLRFKYMRGAK